MKRVASILVAALACSACSGGLLKSDIEPPDVYRLSATEVQHGGQTLGLALAVARPRAPAALDTDRLAVVKPGLGFDYFAGMRWAEPAPSMLLKVDALNVLSIVCAQLRRRPHRAERTDPDREVRTRFHDTCQHDATSRSAPRNWSRIASGAASVTADSIAMHTPEPSLESVTVTLIGK